LHEARAEGEGLSSKNLTHP